MLFVRRLIEFTHLADGERQTPDTEVEVLFFELLLCVGHFFILAIPSCPLALKSLQLVNIACGERTEKDAWSPFASVFARSLRCPLICRQTPTTLIKTLQRRDKMFAARARPLARALVEVFPRSLSRPIGLSLSRRLARSPSPQSAWEDRGGRSLGRLQGGWGSGEAAGNHWPPSRRDEASEIRERRVK